jgi:hypothetical protein
MFYMTMPTTLKIGNTAHVRINKAPAILTWRDEHTVVINHTDERVILHHEVDPETELHRFSCAHGGLTRRTTWSTTAIRRSEETPAERKI